MILSTLRYLRYKLASNMMLDHKAGYNNSIIANETLLSLKNRLKQSGVHQNMVTKNLSTEHLSFGSTIDEVLLKYGKPAFLKSSKSAGITHDVVLYKRMINGQKAKVIYNFVNKSIASLAFQISIIDTDDFTKVSNFVKDTYLSQTEQDLHENFILEDEKGNKLFYEKAFDINLIFVNYNAEIIQNINAAIYHDKYSHVKYVDNTKFQLSI